MMEKQKLPTILVTNDDGYKSKGIAALVQMVKPFGKVVLVAPHEVQSGKSHSITNESPLRLYHHTSEPNLEIYSVTGTPVDCVKMAMNLFFKNSLPNLIVSGINHGSNSSASVVYSGTIGAALEGSMYNVPSIGFSILDYGQSPNFTASVKYGAQIVKRVLENGMPTGFCLNVNIPNIPVDELKGVKVVRQNRGIWLEELEKRVDPQGLDYYWLTGHYENLEPNATGTDEWALANGYISIVPTQPDFTHYAMIDRLKSLEF